jgi:hypothetical protein
LSPRRNAATTRTPPAFRACTYRARKLEDATENGREALAQYVELGDDL